MPQSKVIFRRVGLALPTSREGTARQILPNQRIAMMSNDSVAPTRLSSWYSHLRPRLPPKQNIRLVHNVCTKLQGPQPLLVSALKPEAAPGETTQNFEEIWP